MSRYRGLLVALLVTALLTPIGLYLPEVLKAGAAWGEWGVGEVRKRIGYAPKEMERSAETWKAPIPGYAPTEDLGVPRRERSLRYILSAFLGSAACGGAAYLLARRLTRQRGAPGPGGGAGTA